MSVTTDWGRPGFSFQRSRRYCVRDLLGSRAKVVPWKSSKEIRNALNHLAIRVLKLLQLTTPTISQPGWRHIRLILSHLVKHLFSSPRIRFLLVPSLLLFYLGL